MLASGYSPVYPAHVPLADLRQRCVGTGPFKLKEYVRGQVIELERNPDYFVEDRPYLDGIRYPIITERGTRLAALQAGQLDVSIPLEMTKLMAETAKKNTPALVVTEIAQNGSDNVILNHKRPPFDKVAIRRADQPGPGSPRIRPGRASGRRRRRARADVATVRGLGAAGQRGQDAAGLSQPPPQDKAEAKRLLAAAGVSRTALKVDLVTRNFAIYIDLASFVVDQLKQVGIEAAVTAGRHGRVVSRRSRGASSRSAPT